MEKVLCKTQELLDEVKETCGKFQHCYFNKGTVFWTPDDGANVEFSKKTKLKFLNAKVILPLYKSVLAKWLSDDLYLYTKPDSYRLFFESNGAKSEIIIEELDDNYYFSLWDEGIEFVDCPKNLIQGIAAAEPLVTRGERNSYEDSRIYGVQAEGEYVFGYQKTDLIRFHLSDKLAFPLLLDLFAVKHVLSKVRHRAINRIAHVDGLVIFDLGDLRISLRNYVPLDVLDENGKTDFRFPKISKHKEPTMIPKFNKLFNTPCTTLFKPHKHFKKIIGTCDELTGDLTLTFNKGSIKTKAESVDINYEDVWKVQEKYGPGYDGIALKVKPWILYRCLKEKCLIGCRFFKKDDLGCSWFIYIHHGKTEYLLMALEVSDEHN